tara:strand:+ start:16 stop:261 length:246 start_codon:yes stop_codon:yes gene_type:complete
MKNKLTENMRRFGTKNLHETSDESANKGFAEFLKREYYHPEHLKTAQSIAYEFMMDTDSRVAPSYVKNIFSKELGIEIPLR